MLSKKEEEAVDEAKSWVAEMNNTLRKEITCKLLRVYKVETVYLEDSNREIYTEHLRQELGKVNKAIDEKLGKEIYQRKIKF